MKFKSFSSQSMIYKFRLLFLLNLFFAMFLTKTVSAQFIPSTIPDKVFPTPALGSVLSLMLTGTIPSTSGTMVSPIYGKWPIPYSSPTGGYQNRYRGSSSIASIVDEYGDLYYIKLWGFNIGNIRGAGAGIAYEIENHTFSTVINKGFETLPFDVTEMQVTWIVENGEIYVLAAYISGGDIKLDKFWLDIDPLSPTSGLNLDISFRTMVAPLVAHGTQLQMVTQNNNGHVMLTWHEPAGIYLKAITAETGAIILGPNYLVPGTSGNILPDVALNGVFITDPASTSVTLLTAPSIAHLVYVNPSTFQITKSHLNFYNILNSAGMIVPGFGPSIFNTVDDVETFSSFDPTWDGFQLQLSVVNGDRGFGDLTWAYTYYNNDNNKINLRMMGKRALVSGTIDPFVGPVTYTLNNGSLGNLDITGQSTGQVFANAFPTITYTSPYKPELVSLLGNYNEIAIGWYTTFDPDNISGSNPLYTYSPNSKKYVAVKISDDPALANPLLTPDYLEVSTDNANNNIGGGISIGQGEQTGGWPYMSFSPSNEWTEGGTVFTSFACHGITETYSPPSMTLYGSPNCPHSIPKDPPLAATSLNEASFIATKMINKNTHPSSFKTTNTNAMGSMEPFDFTSNSIIKRTSLGIASSFFTESSKFKLIGTDEQEYKVSLNSIDGRKLFEWKGTLTQINSQIDESSFSTFTSGIYVLNTCNQKGEKQNFKLVKQ